MKKSDMTKADVTSLMDAGKHAWEDLGPSGRKAHFSWRGRRYVAHHSTFRLFVDGEDGERIACRYD